MADPDLPEQVQQWFDTAEADLQTARHLYEADDYKPMMFHIQQSIEKALKGALIIDGGDYIRTHSLMHLHSAYPVPERYETLLKDLDTVYVEVRYPDTPDADINEPETALQQAKELVQWIKKQSTA